MEFTRPAEQVVRILNDDQTVFLEARTIELDMLLAKAQAGTDPVDPFSIDIWVDRFKGLLEETYKLENITRQDAWIVSRAVNASMHSLKKTLPFYPMLQRPTE